jgi:hypothetical protein
MLSDLASLDPHQADKVAAWAAERAAEALEMLADDLFCKAFILWRAKSLVRASDEEPSCAVVFYGCCLEVISSQETILRIVSESDQPTRRMLAGIDSPSSAARPDMSILYGPRYTIRIEAKRLMRGEGLPRLYVQEGMRRFIDGKYSSTPGKPGYMLGFVVRDETADIVSAINRVILRESDLEASDQLTDVTIPSPKFSRWASTHANDLRLIHNLLDVRLPP